MQQRGKCRTTLDARTNAAAAQYPLPPPPPPLPPAIDDVTQLSACVNSCILQTHAYARARDACTLRAARICDAVAFERRYARWCNELTQEQLLTHRFKDCTIIQPTWFMARSTFDNVGGYRDSLAEDLLFLYDHVECHLRIAAAAAAAAAASACAADEGGGGGSAANGDRPSAAAGVTSATVPVPTLPPPLVKIDSVLLEYTHRGSESLTPRVSKELLRSIRIAALQR